eukprot:TRINITY_DN86498_c0_g1_i1.p1 TRINITY_DN86498_c0_g1~~TRINITY_DN86498_c0_g1_i1.p1  ORF type:complete len:300 (+),score=-1.25 TRINITY_DN86498_c0_g1_i1:68-901(+)
MNNVMAHGRGGFTTGYWKDRSEDPDISPNGEKQSNACGLFLSGKTGDPASLLYQGEGSGVKAVPITKIFTSAMKRAMRTGLIVATHMNMKVNIFPETFECGGCYNSEDGQVWNAQPGMTKQHIQATYPNVELQDGDSVTENGWYDVNRGRESADKAAERARQVVDKFFKMAKEVLAGQEPAKTEATTHWARLKGSATNPQDAIVLVTHGDFLRCIFNDIDRRATNGWDSPTSSFNSRSSIFHLFHNCGISCVDFHHDNTAYIHNLNFNPLTLPQPAN